MKVTSTLPDPLASAFGVQAYEEAMLRGMCEAGAREYALDAKRALSDSLGKLHEVRQPGDVVMLDAGHETMPPRFEGVSELNNDAKPTTNAHDRFAASQETIVSSSILFKANMISVEH